MKAVFPALAVLAGCTTSVLAQTTWTVQMRLIADGDAESPTGSWAQLPNDPNAPRIGFWLQCRVSQSGGTNYGIGRVASPPVPGASNITLAGSSGAWLERGTINAGGTQYGRGTGFRFSNGNRPAWDTPASNAPDGGVYPSALHNDNGALDSGQARIYGFDAWVGAQRTTADESDPNPWGAPLAGTGVFSPWQNIFRFVVVNGVNASGPVVINAAAQVNGTAGVQQLGGTNWVMQLGTAQNATATYTLNLNQIPTPGAAAILGLGGLVAARRRR